MTGQKMINLKEMLVNLVQFIWDLLKRIWCAVFNVPKKTTNEDNSSDESDFDINDWKYDDWDLHEDKTIFKNVETETAEQNYNPFEHDKYQIKKDIIYIYPAVTCVNIPGFMTEKTIFKDYLKIFTDGEFKGLECKVKIQSTTLTLMPQKVMNIKAQLEDCEVYELNPQIMSNNKIYDNYIPVNHFKRLTEVYIYSKRMSHNVQTISSTMPTLLLNAPVINNKKPIIMTVGMVLTIPDEDDNVWIGSVIKAKNNIYLVVDKLEYNSPKVIKLICSVVGQHRYTFKIIQG